MAVTSDPPDDFRYASSAVHDGRITLARLEFSGDCRVRCPSLGEYVLVWSPQGRHRWAVGQESGVGRIPFLITPDRLMDIDMGRVHLLSVGFERDYFERAVGGAPRDGINSLAHNPASLAPVMRYLDSTMREHPGVFAEPVFRANAVQLVLDSVRRVFPLDGRPDRAAGTRTVREAVAYLDGHPTGAVPTVDLAEAVGVTRSSLEQGFARVLGMTPRAFARRLRLSRRG